MFCAASMSFALLFSLYGTTRLQATPLDFNLCSLQSTKNSGVPEKTFILHVFLWSTCNLGRCSENTFTTTRNLYLVPDVWNGKLTYQSNLQKRPKELLIHMSSDIKGLFASLKPKSVGPHREHQRESLETEFSKPFFVATIRLNHYLRMSVKEHFYPRCRPSHKETVKASRENVFTECARRKSN